MVKKSKRQVKSQHQQKVAKRRNAVAVADQKKDVVGNRAAFNPKKLIADILKKYGA